MRRTLRVRIVAGLSVMLGGLAFSAVAPAIVMFLFLKTPSPEDLESRLPELTMAIGEAGRIASVSSLVGRAISAAAALYTFATWARWFVGSQADSITQAEATVGGVMRR